MESKTGFCIYCHSAVSYREEETYVLCKCCHRSFVVALFGADTRELDEAKQQLKLRQEVVEQLTADKQKLEAEKLEHREKLSGALASLASINDELSA